MVEELYREIKTLGFLEVINATEFFETVKRFFFAKEIVYDSWYVPLDNFEFSASDFYQMIEKELTVRKVPGLDIIRTELGEGGHLSANRQYLRLRRERLAFDICAAPFGTSYFFSFRSVELPLGFNAVELLIFVVSPILILSLFIKIFGIIWGTLALLFLFYGGVWLLRNTVTLGLKDLDRTLLKTPIIGPVYEAFFRKETYYREDSRAMYLTTVNAITKALVEEVTAVKGIKLAKRYNRPISDELSREKSKPPSSKATA